MIAFYTKGSTFGLEQLIVLDRGVKRYYYGFRSINKRRRWNEFSYY